jgi:hypothetical protein
MFAVTEEEAAAIRAAFDRDGEFASAGPVVRQDHRGMEAAEVAASPAGLPGVAYITDWRVTEFAGRGAPFGAGPLKRAKPSRLGNGIILA